MRQAGFDSSLTNLSVSVLSEKLKQEKKRESSDKQKLSASSTPAPVVYVPSPSDKELPRYIINCALDTR